MDSMLIDYLKSGSAWLLVGSGPSIAMGYPDWEKLASIAVEGPKIENTGQDIGTINSALKQKNIHLFYRKCKIL